MSNLTVIVDSGAGFSKEWYEQNGLLVAQHSVAFEGEEPKPEFEVRLSEYYERLRNSSPHPRTASPNSAQFGS